MKRLIISVVVLGGLFYMTKLDSGTRGIRNNNPMNIRENHKVDFDWVGERLTDDDPEFEEFKTPIYGIRAGARVLKTYRERHNLKTVHGIVNRWAPPSENETQSYVAAVSAKLGVSPSDVLSVEDYPQLIAAMIHHENGSQPYTMEEINTGFAMGFA